jgi:hypothetical protein
MEAYNLASAERTGLIPISNFDVPTPPAVVLAQTPQKSK